MVDVELVKKAIKHRLEYLERVYTPPKIEVIDDAYVYYRHDLIRINRPKDRRYKDLINLSKRVARFMQHIFFGTPVNFILGRVKTITYVMLISIPEQTICATCTIATANINGVAFLTGICTGTPKCIDKIVEKEKLELLLLPDKKDIPSCKDYAPLRKHYPSINTTLTHYLCLTKYSKY